MTADPRLQELLRTHLLNGRLNLADRDVSRGALLFPDLDSLSAKEKRAALARKDEMWQAGITQKPEELWDWLTARQYPSMSEPEGLRILGQILEGKGSLGHADWLVQKAIVTPGEMKVNATLSYHAIRRTDGSVDALRWLEANHIPLDVPENRAIMSQPSILHAVNTHRFQSADQVIFMLDHGVRPTQFRTFVPAGEDEMMDTPLSALARHYKADWDRLSPGKVLNFQRIWTALVAAGEDPECVAARDASPAQLIAGTPGFDWYVAQSRAARSRDPAMDSSSTPRPRARP